VFSTGLRRPRATSCSPPASIWSRWQNSIGVDSLAFISIDGLYRAMGEQERAAGRPQFCDACFTGDYPIPLADADDGKVSVQLSLLAETASAQSRPWLTASPAGSP